jgi:hypothetical protein
MYQRDFQTSLVMTSHVTPETDLIEQKRGNKFRMGASVGVQHNAEYFIYVERNNWASGRKDLLENKLEDDNLRDLDGKEYLDFFGGKAKQIRDMFKMWYFDVQWSRPSKMDQNPMAWMVMVNGFIMDVRTLPQRGSRRPEPGNCACISATGDCPGYRVVQLHHPLASLIPVAGSAYNYAYATMGEVIAWIIGWDLTLEYAMGSSAVSSGWSNHFIELLGSWGVKIPLWMTYDHWTGVKTAQNLIADLYPEIIAAAKIEPVDFPDVVILSQAEGKPFSFRLQVDVYPEVKIGRFKGIGHIHHIKECPWI